MTSQRKSAIWVGVLYILATVAGIASVGPSGTLTGGPGILANAAAHESDVIVLVLLNLVMAVAVAGVAFMIYPILKQDADTETKQGLALWYVGTRITEGAVFVVAILAMLSLLTLSQEFASAGSPAGSYYQTAAVVLEDVGNFGWSLGQSVFSVGAAMLYYLLYVSKRVPRWISVWGLVATPLFLAASLSLLFTGDPNSTVSSVLYAPLGLQEMVLAVWLIFKGFRTASSSVGLPIGRGGVQASASGGTA
ncbi:MAG: DUF4386 domain-containing protein [Thermoleophilia bacterium]